MASQGNPSLPLPSFTDVQQAYAAIQDRVHRTPVMSSRQVDERAGCRVLFKCENFQRVGAFKFRGACHTVFSLSEQEAEGGVATHSSGNHAQAIALAARMRGIPAHIVMPENAPAIKKRAVAGYGADITYCTPTLKARESTLEAVVERTGATFIHPYNDPRIIAGQGTAALELLQDHPGINVLLAPVGGGGLASGTAIAAHGVDPAIRVIGCEPALADDAYLSLQSGRLMPPKDTQTVADGLRTGLGELTFACLQEYLHAIVTVTEEEIVEAMRFIWERMNIIVEASSAVPLAALFSGKIDDPGPAVGVILSGGNLDLDHLPWDAE